MKILLQRLLFFATLALAAALALLVPTAPLLHAAQPDSVLHLARVCVC